MQITSLVIRPYLESNITKDYQKLRQMLGKVAESCAKSCGESEKLRRIGKVAENPKNSDFCREIAKNCNIATFFLSFFLLNSIFTLKSVNFDNKTCTFF